MASIDLRAPVIHEVRPAAAAAEHDDDDMQMQPLDLSCPKSTCRKDSEDSERPRSSGSEESADERAEHHRSALAIDRHAAQALFERTHASAHPANQAVAAAAAAVAARTLTKAALKQLVGGAGSPYSMPPLPILGGPARKRFLSKYLHKENGKLILICPPVRVY